MLGNLTRSFVPATRKKREETKDERRGARSSRMRSTIWVTTSSSSKPSRHPRREDRIKVWWSTRSDARSAGCPWTEATNPPADLATSCQDSRGLATCAICRHARVARCPGIHIQQRRCSCYSCVACSIVQHQQKRARHQSNALQYCRHARHQRTYHCADDSGRTQR